MAQNALDTRALELAAGTRDKLEQHLRECEIRDARLWEQSQLIRGSVGKVHERVDALSGQLSSELRGHMARMLAISGGLILLLLGVIGALFWQGPPWAGP